MASVPVFVLFFPLVCLVVRGFLDEPTVSFEDVASFRLPPTVDIRLEASESQMIDSKRVGTCSQNDVVSTSAAGA